MHTPGWHKNGIFSCSKDLAQLHHGPLSLSIQAGARVITLIRPGFVVVVWMHMKSNSVVPLIRASCERNRHICFFHRIQLDCGGFIRLAVNGESPASVLVGEILIIRQTLQGFHYMLTKLIIHHPKALGRNLEVLLGSVCGGVNEAAAGSRWTRCSARLAQEST